MFKKVLIANRGLVAANCVRAVRELGACAAVVYETSDLGSAAVRAADEAIEIRSSNGSTAYLDVNAIVDAAVMCGADAVHPGYGFLAKSQELAHLLKERDIAFLSAPLFPRTKEVAQKLGIGVLPGTPLLRNWAEVESSYAAVGFPLVVRAVASYGGWGHRVVNDLEELRPAWDHVAKQCERHGVPGDIVLEKYLPDAHQVEFPVLRDHSGRVLALPEFETSVQRRFQKLIAESPAPSVKGALRGQIESSIPALVNQLGLEGFASVVFQIVGGEAYLSEVDGSIQASHSVTSLFSGVNVIREQVRVASGEALRIQEEHVQRRGHVIGAFLYATDPYRKFTPSPGRIGRFHAPMGEGIVLLSTVAAGDIVSPHYDPNIATLLVHDSTREEAITRMRLALADFFVDGIQTTLPLLRAIVDSADFVKVEISTSYLFSEDRRVQLLKGLRNEEDDEIAALVAALALNTDANASQIMESAQHGGLLWAMASRVLNRKKMEF
ncbi:MAG TPA: biotin carboxylase N-terminal domain-containing protein [Fibrobacteraceae bacterium]|nr:biotin carboxylase N-terminal domain-containing protein [Fibrobacteraceae bacterium]